MILRLLLMLTALTVVVSGGLYVSTGNRRYLRFAWQVLRLVVFLLLVFALLYLLERVFVSV